MTAPPAPATQSLLQPVPPPPGLAAHSPLPPPAPVTPSPRAGPPPSRRLPHPPRARHSFVPRRPASFSPSPAPPRARHSFVPCRAGSFSPSPTPPRPSLVRPVPGWLLLAVSHAPAPVTRSSVADTRLPLAVFRAHVSLTRLPRAGLAPSRRLPCSCVAHLFAACQPGSLWPSSVLMCRSPVCRVPGWLLLAVFLTRVPLTRSPCAGVGSLSPSSALMCRSGVCRAPGQSPHPRPRPRLHPRPRAAQAIAARSLGLSVFGWLCAMVDLVRLVLSAVSERSRQHSRPAGTDRLALRAV
ncbi:hypothetical protein FHR83_003930 [Actinoplanes campanulatus]|uniref:Uncharacterized protein n=1 Tax=Actinoplanes campanulatus TaxID=113559 RepID=A0A7W5AHN7_9ACTN|nr:hypothetical protein [Actinoplanes campanulatus]